MKQFSLFQRLALALVISFIVILSLFFVWSQQLAQNSKAEGEQRLHLGLAEHLVQDNPLLQQGVYDKYALENLFHTLMVLGPNFEFYYLNTQGEILTYSAEPGKVKREFVDLIPILEMLKQPKAFPLYGDDPRSLEKKKIFSAAPIYIQQNGAEQKLQGYLYVIIGGEIHDNIFDQLKQSETLQASVTILLAGGAFLLCVLLLLLRYFTRPLSRLSQEVAKVDLSNDGVMPQTISKWPAQSSNEVERLGSVFGSLIERVQDQMTQLRNLDLHRRELLADLSHDLRTPLASLQGYIETIAINPNLPTEQRENFIDISLKNAQALRRLIDQIFELAYLEGGQVKVSFESFPLGELVHDVVAKFVLSAQKKQIQITVNPEQFNYQVYTDIAKLERVISNLLDNAIRHTPEQGQISINISPAEGEANRDKLKIEISDTGVGISEQEVAYIFDARYRASNTKGKKGQNAGLGLAITKKLINLLNSDIAVNSELGKGTSFSFYVACQTN